MLPIKTLALRGGWIPLLVIPLIIVGSYELAIHFPIHKHHPSQLGKAVFPKVSNISDQIIFPGFTIYDSSSLDGIDLPHYCQVALVQKIQCEDTLAGYVGPPARRGSIEDKELYDEVCDGFCRWSLEAYFDIVKNDCHGYNISGAPAMMLGGYMWEAYNETCYLEPQSGRYCNEIIDGFTKVADVYDMPHDELCSYCNTMSYQMRQASQYSAFDATHDPDRIDYINKHCNLDIPREPPSPLGQVA